MSGTSLVLVMLLAGAILGALLLFSSPSPAPTVALSDASGGDLAMASQAAASTASPWVDAGVDRTVGERETIRLAGSGGDTAGGTVSYRWTTSGGLGFLADPSEPNTTYTTPSACDCQQTVTLTLTVTNRGGISASDSIALQIRDPMACPPERPACGGIAVTSSPCGSVPQSPCPPKPDVPCAGPCISQAPTRLLCSQAPVPCRCAQGCAAAWDSAWLQPTPALAAKDRPAPRIVRQYPAHVAEGSVVALRAVVANPACSSVCFTWSASQGWFERADTLEPVYHAPQTERREGERVTITFTIHDATGQPSSDQIRLEVDNQPSS
jgi:hypothetical protein